MHTRDLSPWLHPHVFDRGNPEAERSTRLAVAVSAVMMIVEILAGWSFNSMALLADGWHMSSHVLALGLSAAAYVAARRFARDARFTWGAWKIEVLGAYTSGIMLIGIAAVMAWESARRLVEPSPIAYDQALVVAILGLFVNVVCAVVLGRNHDHEEGHHHEHDHAHHHHAEDLNLRSAYLHVLMDALTSVLAIVALISGKYLGLIRLDSIMGLFGSILVAAWAWGLIRRAASVLLDAEMDSADAEKIRSLIETEAGGSSRVTDLHIWRVGKKSYSAVVGIVTHSPNLTPSDVKRLLAARKELAHVIVEIQRCPGDGGGCHSSTSQH